MTPPRCVPEANCAENQHDRAPDERPKQVVDPNIQDRVKSQTANACEKSVVRPKELSGRRIFGDGPRVRKETCEEREAG
jgi:hypothetical protein